MNIDREQYEKDLEKRQKDHLNNINRGLNTPHWRPCLHDACNSCFGTGVKIDGSPCVHMMSCWCPKCTPYC